MFVRDDDGVPGSLTQWWASIKLGLAESSHDRSLLTAELRFGWVADSGRFVSALQP